MGCTTSIPQNDEDDPFLQDKRINDAIEQGMQMNKVNEKNLVKLLLLGTGESGKSTVLKQLKVLHKGGFTQQERVQYAHVIWCDAIQSMRILIYQARRLGVPLECDKDGSPLSFHRQVLLRTDPLAQVDTGAAGGSNFLNDYVVKYGEKNKNQRRLNSTGVTDNSFWENEYIMGDTPVVGLNADGTPKLTVASSVGDAANQDLTGLVSNNAYRKESTSSNSYTRQQVAEAIHKLWQDPGIKQVYDRAHEFQLEGSANYYFDNIHKFGDPDYLCNDLDILKGRIKTTGITETQFLINSFKFKVLDAGGQRSERKKWIHCFQNITAVLFVIAISEYDQMLFEDERVNRMHESIVLFDSLCNSRWFVNTPFILFLNKIDLFEQKLHRSPLKDYFPDFNGKPDDVDDAIKFFEKNFLKLNRTGKPMYVHRTCATDTKSMKFVLFAVTDMIVHQNLKKSGIL